MADAVRFLFEAWNTLEVFMIEKEWELDGVVNGGDDNEEGPVFDEQ
jgi:hypothetical protein